MTRSDRERMDRLASEAICTVCHAPIRFVGEDGDIREQKCKCEKSAPRGGGGLVLSSLFGDLLEQLLDNGATADEQLARVAERSCVNKTKRLAETWGGSWESLTRDAMDQLEHKGYAQRAEDGCWVLGGNFTTGELLETIPARKGRNGADHVKVWPKAERERLTQEAVDAAKRADVIRQPRTGRWGPGSDARQAAAKWIRDSIDVVGKINPVLMDQNGRIIAGRTRYDIDRSWPIKELAVSTDEEVLNVMRLLDDIERGEPLSGPDRKRLDELVVGGVALEGLRDSQANKRSRIEAALREDASRSNVVIAELVGASHPTVANVREVLENSSSTSERIHRYEFGGGQRGGKGVRVGQHSAECWCPADDPARAAGDVKPKQKAPPRGKSNDPVVIDALEQWIDEGRTRTRPDLPNFVTEQTGITLSHGVLEAKLKELRAARPVVSSAPEPETMIETMIEEPAESTAEPEESEPVVVEPVQSESSSELVTTTTTKRVHDNCPTCTCAIGAVYDVARVGP